MDRVENASTVTAALSRIIFLFCSFLGCQFLFEVENKLHKSSCTEVYYQTGLQSTESNMLLELLAQLISEPCFSTLRTKEQLGYIVFSGVRKTNGAQGLRIIVQSDKHPEYVEQRINVFLDSMLVGSITSSIVKKLYFRRSYRKN